ncbi:uncharacterized protein [Onthophagus taurus]|uniref:uncharacterized protein n=1 Tax=Onthophagus taurus TaxID=166361 RepID=UPI0039BE7510
MNSFSPAKKAALQSDEYKNILKQLQPGCTKTYPMRSINKNTKASKPWHCNVCGGQFRSIQGVLEVERVATCTKCKQKICKIRCSNRDPLKGWICQLCQQPEAWFKVILNAIHPNKGTIFSNMDQEGIDELDEDLRELRKKEREQVRDFIERLVESLLGGTLDDVNIRRLYNDRKYDALFERYHSDLSNALTDLGSALHISISNLPITGQSPCTAHATLKQLIQRFSSEAGELPELKRIQNHPAVPEEEVSDRTYEDLLSTAIINKVVQCSQNGARSNSDSVSSRASRRTIPSTNGKDIFFSRETLDDKWRNIDNPEEQHDDTSSVSSLDEWVRSDSSIGSAKYVDRISLTIKQHINENNSSCDEISDVESNPNSLEAEDAWSENWYFQKKLRSSNSPVPVPMLVPNPIEEAKVYIGDKEAGEISDIESDYGEAEVVPDIKHILVNSRTIIGGKNVLENVEVVADITNNQNGVEQREKTVSVIKENGLNHREVDNFEVAHLVSEETQDVSLLSIDSQTEKDTEYTEQYASLPRTIVKEPKPVPRTYASRRKAKINQETKENGHIEVEEMKTPGVISNGFKENGIQEKSELNGDSISEELIAFEGSYSKKEKEKWKHAVDLKNNPYSPENLERRLSNSSSTSSSLFGRDYYIRQASRSAGISKKDYAAATEEIRGYELDDETLVTAVPAVIYQEEDQQYPSMSESSATITSLRPNRLDISSDSDMSIERIYNPQTGTMTVNSGGVIQEFSVSSNPSTSPEGLKYIKKEFDEPIDENHNQSLSIEEQKQEFLRSLTIESDQSTPIIEDIVATPASIIEDVPYEFESISNGFERNQLKEDIAPSLKKSLSKFDDITNEFSNTKEIVYKTHEYNLINDQKNQNEHDEIDVTLDKNLVQEFDFVLKMKDYPQIPAKYFGEVKSLVDDKPATKTSDYSEEESFENKDFSLEYSTDITDDASRPESALETDPEIIDLKEKKLVKDLLGKYSKSISNVALIPQKKNEETGIKKQISLENIVQNGENLNEVELEENGCDENNQFNHIPSVQNLKKIFDRQPKEILEVKKDVVNVYSLTARSLPKSITQQLKNDEDLSVKTEEENLPTNEEDEELLPADITRNRIKFFEELERTKH